jgi:heat shock protein HslJ
MNGSYQWRTSPRHAWRWLAVVLSGFAASVIMHASPSNAQDLAGTSWLLVEIASMDDTTFTPDDSSKYTLEFLAEGRAAIRADCNRGTGSWASQSPGQLTFGPIAATRAMCPPGSLSDRYLGQFEWVRSYVMENGHLFLATMADGAIIEFAPAGDSAATVFGEEIRTTDAGRLQELILTRLFDRYAAEKGIVAEPAQVDAYLEKLDRAMAGDGNPAEKTLSPEESAQVAAMRRAMAQSIVRQWKINKALHAQYGGRIVYQQLGPEPLDAYRQFLEEARRNGDFAIADQARADAFWRYFTDDSMHDFMQPGSADEQRAFAEPPWSEQ